MVADGFVAGTLTNSSGTIYDAKAYSASTGPDTNCIASYAKVLGKRTLATSPFGEQTFTKVRFVFTDYSAAERWWPAVERQLVGKVEMFVGNEDVLPRLTSTGDVEEDEA